LHRPIHCFTRINGDNPGGGARLLPNPGTSPIVCKRDMVPAGEVLRKMAVSAIPGAVLSDGSALTPSVDVVIPNIIGVTVVPDVRGPMN